MKANGNFSDASVEYFYSVRINRMMSPSEAVDLGSPPGLPDLHFAKGPNLLPKRAKF